MTATIAPIPGSSVHRVAATLVDYAGQHGSASAVKQLNRVTSVLRATT